MYNLTVDVAHTFFVGEQQWLVHNADCPKLRIDTTQFGHKVGQHAQDYGLAPGNQAHRDWIQNHIEDIGNNFVESRQGAWRGGCTDCIFYRKEADVVVAKANGDFITILKGGINNKFFVGASPIE